jgi:hypothetical protein
MYTCISTLSMFLNVTLCSSAKNVCKVVNVMQYAHTSSINPKITNCYNGTMINWRRKNITLSEQFYNPIEKS